MATNILDKVKNPDEIDEEAEAKVEEQEFEKPEIIHTEDITDVIKGTTTEDEEEKEESEEVSEETTEMTEVKELIENIEENLTKSQNLFNKTEINEALEKEEQKEREEAVEEFYTKSVDLSDEDIEMSDDFKEKKLPLGVKILIFLVIVAIIAATGYFIYLKLI